MLKTSNEQLIEREMKGKTIEDISISEHSVVIKLSDGNFVDIDLHEKELKTTMNMY